MQPSFIDVVQVVLIIFWFSISVCGSVFYHKLGVPEQALGGGFGIIMEDIKPSELSCVSSIIFCTALCAISSFVIDACLSGSEVQPINYVIIGIERRCTYLHT